MQILRRAKTPRQLPAILNSPSGTPKCTKNVLGLPLLVFALSHYPWSRRVFHISWGFVSKESLSVEAGQGEDLDFVIPATLTLLGLIIGFSFSMVSGHYDLRKNDEEAEANAIGTEYVRADSLPASDAVGVRELLKRYLDQRRLFYQTRDEHQLGQINVQTTGLQSELWSVVEAAAAKQPTYPVGLAISGMNDLLNSQGYTEAACWYRLPVGAWVFMFAIAIFRSWLIGYSPHQLGRKHFPVLPLAVSISFFAYSRHR